MKRVAILLSVLTAAAAEWPHVRLNEYRQQVEFRYPEPLVSQTTVQNGWNVDDKRLSDKDLGRDVFTITGDEQHKPIPVWRDQDTLNITFPVGTSCATEYRFRLNPGTCYLGGASAPQEEKVFHCPPDKLQGVAFMDDKGLGVLVHARAQITRESRELSADSHLRFAFREAVSHPRKEEVVYKDRVEAVLEPACLKQLNQSDSLQILADRGADVWKNLTPDSPLPGHVVVRPAAPLAAGKTWHLLVEPGEHDGFSGAEAVCADTDFAPELPSGVSWELRDNKTYRLRVSFGAPMNAAEMPDLFRRMQLAMGEQVATDAGEGKKQLLVNGKCYEFRYAGVQEMPSMVSYGGRKGGDLVYVPQNQARGFWIEVDAPAPAVLDVVLPADVSSFLGWKMRREHRHRIALNPAMPVLKYGETTLLPLQGERTLRLPFANLGAVKVSAWRLLPEKRELAMKGDLSCSVALRHLKLRYELMKNRQWKGLRVPDGLVSDMQETLEHLLKEEQLRVQNSREVLEGAAPMPGYVLNAGESGMLQSGEGTLRLDDVVGGVPAPGMYLLRLQPQTSAHVREALRLNEQEEDLLDAQVDVLVQVTDLNVMPGEGAVLVNRYSDGNPLETGELTYRDAGNRLCQVAVENGIAWLPQDFRARGAVQVSAGDDAVLVNDMPPRRPFSREKRRGYSTMLVLDRPLYRPGDTVNVRGVLRRQLPDGSCELPAGKSAKVTISRPDGQKLETREVSLGEFGAFEMSFALPKGEDDVAGYYALQVESGKFRQRASVNCQVFRRDAFKASLELEVNPVAPSNYAVRVAALDYSGVPLAGAVCRLDVGGQSKEVVLDAEGKAEITGDVTDEMRRSQGIHVSGSVSNDREEHVRMSPVHKSIYPADFYMSVRGGRLVLRDSRSAAVLEREQVVEVKLVRTESKPSVGANGLGSMESSEQVLWSGSLTVPAACQTGLELPLELLAKHAGAQIWKLSARDAEGRETTLSCPIWRFQPDAADPVLLMKYQEGALVLRADLPRAVKAHLFIGCGQKLRHQVLPVVGGEQELRVPLQSGEEGNVCATLVLPGRTADEVPVVLSAHCFVPITRYHLDVELQLPQQVCRPAETVTLSGRVLADGKPADAEVTFYAVDAGMLSVGRYEAPAPEEYFCRGGGAPGFSLPYFYTRNRSGKESINLTLMPGFWQGDIVGEGSLLEMYGDVLLEMYGDVLPGLYVDGVAAQGARYKRASKMKAPMAVNMEFAAESGTGDDLCAPAPMVAVAGAAPEEMPCLRTNFAPVALWQGALRTDAEGRFSAQVTLPDTLTTYRVFAVALDKSGKRFGSAQGEFTVAQPVMLTPGTPLFMSLGDALRLPLSIVNNTDEQGTWNVMLEGASDAQEITLAPHQSGTLFFDFKAVAEGEQKLRWVAQGKPGSDAVQGEFSVRFPAPVLKEVHRMALAPGEQAVALASLMGGEVAASSRGQMQLVVSANPLLHLAGAADFLLTYPYGCTEQRASALIPWLLYRHLAPFCPLMAQTPPDEVKATVEEIVQEILSRQCKDGGLSYWGGRRESCLWASAHAAYVLKLAQEQGYDVPQEALENLIHYLWQADTKKLSARARFCIARTRGKTGAMMDILREMLQPGEKQGFSDRESRAGMQFILSMLENPAGADAAFRTWMRTAGRDYRHGSTQTHAWTLLALVEYVHLKKNAAAEATLVLNDGSELRLGMGATEVPLAWQPGQEMKALSTTLAAARGTVYATLSLRALPPTTDYPGVTERGLQVTRLYETRGADGIWRPATTFKVGDVVRVTLTCAKVADELKYLVLEDYMPACMEAINPNVPGQSAGLPPLEWSWWFDHREYLADRVRGFCTRWEGRDLLNMRYYARVKRSGTSTAPPAQAQLMYEPQVYGLSPNSRLISEP